MLICFLFPRLSPQFATVYKAKDTQDGDRIVAVKKV